MTVSATLHVSEVDAFVAWTEKHGWTKKTASRSHQPFKLTAPGFQAAVFCDGAVNEITAEDNAARLVRTWRKESHGSAPQGE